MHIQSLTQLGYFGKIPSNGDFVSKGLPRSFIDPWDLWLQEALTSCRQQLGKDWLDYYLTGPVYRFALGPRICGETGAIGILMPSVDKVGRYYPMTICMLCQEISNPFLALPKKDWYDKMEHLALSCLKDSYGLAQLDQELDKLREEACCKASDGQLTIMEELKQQSFASAWQQTLLSIDEVADTLPKFLDSLLKDQCFAYSLWWTGGSDAVEPSLLFTEGLPPYSNVAAMYDGQWHKWGWAGKRFSTF